MVLIEVRCGFCHVLAPKVTMRWNSGMGQYYCKNGQACLKRRFLRQPKGKG